MSEQNKNGLMNFLFGSPKKIEQGGALASLPGQGSIDFSNQKPEVYQDSKDSNLVHFQFGVVDQLPKNEFKQVTRTYVSNETANKPYRIMAIPEALADNDFDVVTGSEILGEDEIKKHPLLQLGAEGSVVTEELLAAFEVNEKKVHDLLEAPSVVSKITESGLMLMQRGMSVSKTGKVMKAVDFILVIPEGSYIKNPLKPKKEEANLLDFPAIPEMPEKKAA